MTGIAEVPGALWVPADPTNYRPRPQAQGGIYTLIVVHITDGHADASGDATMWQGKGHGTSSHFVVGQDGTLIQCVPLAMAAQHAHACNAYSIGIEHCCRSPREWSPTDPGLPPTDALYETSAKLVAYLCKAAGLPISRNVIKGHAEADPQTTHADCPNGAPWDWDGYMARVVSEYAALSPLPVG